MRIPQAAGTRSLNLAVAAGIGLAEALRQTEAWPIDDMKAPEGRRIDEQERESPPDKSPSERIDERIAELGDWRGETLARIRALIREAVPDVVEEWKWRGRPGLVARRHDLHRRDLQTGRQADLRQGRPLDDPERLFNSSLEGNTRRAIDIREGEAIDEEALKNLIRAAAALNASGAKR